MGWAHYNNSIYKTVNAGIDWSVQLSYVKGDGRSIEFLSPQIGYAGCLDNKGTVFQTLDGGIHWDTIANPVFDSIYGICGMSHYQHSIFMCGAYFGRPVFIKSNNNGLTWKKVKLDSLASGLVDCHFFNESEGLICGRAAHSRGGIILRTDDGGDHWRIADTSTGHDTTVFSNYVWKFTFLNDTAGFASVQNPFFKKGHILKTMDAGNSWTLIESKDINYFLLQGIGFVNDSVGYCGGWTSGMYQTKDGGHNWKYLPIGYNFNRYFKTPGKEIYFSGNSIYRYNPNAYATDVQPLIFPAVHKLNKPFPNPANDNIFINYELSFSTYVQLSLYNQEGKKIYNFFQGERWQGIHEQIFYIENLPAGIYWIEMLTHETHFAHKLVIQH